MAYPVASSFVSHWQHAAQDALSAISSAVSAASVTGRGMIRTTLSGSLTASMDRMSLAFRHDPSWRFFPTVYPRCDASPLCIGTRYGHAGKPRHSPVQITAASPWACCVEAARFPPSLSGLALLQRKTGPLQPRLPRLFQIQSRPRLEARQGLSVQNLCATPIARPSDNRLLAKIHHDQLAHVVFSMPAPSSVRPFFGVST